MKRNQHNIHKKIKVAYIVLLSLFFLSLTIYFNNFVSWKLYLIYIIILLLFVALYKLVSFDCKKIEILQENIKRVEKEIQKNRELQAGDVVEIRNLRSEHDSFLDSNYPQGIISAVSKGMASVQVKDEIKMIEIKYLKIVKTNDLKFKELFFLGSSLLELLQNLNEHSSQKKKEKFYKKLKECVDFFRNGDFGDEYNEINSKFSEYGNVENYFKDLKRIIEKSIIKLKILKYNSFEIDLAVGLLFDEEGQKSIINSVDALRLVKKYLNIN